MNKSTAIIGGVLIFLGLFFLLRSLDLIWFSFGDAISFLFPLALIAAGIWLIGRHKKGGQFNATINITETPSQSRAQSAQPTGDDPSNLARQQASFAGAPTPPPTPETEDSSRPAPPGQAGGKLRFNKLMGDMFVDCEGFNLGNVEISSGIGDLEIKVSGGLLAKGLNRMIISGFIGDVRIFVPKDWPFFAHCSNFVGDIEIGGKRSSGFGNTVEHQTNNYEKSESKLYLAANSFIGDMKIYQV